MFLGVSADPLPGHVVQPTVSTSPHGRKDQHPPKSRDAGEEHVGGDAAGVHSEGGHALPNDGPNVHVLVAHVGSLAAHAHPSLHVQRGRGTPKGYRSWDQ